MRVGRRFAYFCGGLAQLGEHLPYKQGSAVRARHPPPFWSRGVAVNMPACHAGDRRFDPGRDRHYYCRCSSVGRATDL